MSAVAIATIVIAVTGVFGTVGSLFLVWLRLGKFMGTVEAHIKRNADEHQAMRKDIDDGAAAHQRHLEAHMVSKP